jgi:hypothetical protein
MFELETVAARKVPDRQLEHEVEPLAVWYCPATQSRHEEDPLLATYLPVPQLVQALVDEPDRPR